MEKENVVVNEEGKKAIILTSEGDLRHARWFQNFCLSDDCPSYQICRKAITSLQSCARLKGDVEVS